MIFIHFPPDDIFIQKKPHWAFWSDTPWESLTCFHRDQTWKVSSTQHKHLPEIYQKTSPKMTILCASCWETTIPTLPSYWGPMLASVWRTKTRLKHKPSHLPSPCPPPPCPRLLLNQLCSLPSLSVCQNQANVFLFLPAAKQPEGVLQRIAVLIQTLGFAESAGSGAVVRIVHNCAACRVGTFFLIFERTLAKGTICRILSFEGWKHRQLHLNGEWNFDLYSELLEKHRVFVPKVIGFASQGR